MSEETIYVAYPVFRADPDRLASVDRTVAAKEIAALLDSFGGRVENRGIYSTAGFTAHADLMFWWIGPSADDLQDVMTAFRQTEVGRALEHTEVFLGLVQPAEFAPDHRPSFVAGKDPLKYLCVYPFVRTPEWYLLEPSERAKLLREHGEAARSFSDVQANTTMAFGLGDWEWILAFEAESPVRIVELIRQLRATEARRYTKVEIPFVTGIRKPIEAAIADLP
ncbi:MAG TPA: hydrogen peroxide-dependent heme synthase [Actinomycetota bacterium]|jgi:chlorite dismutase|nr:hydrogen peroxide-dependent heme synthase [Actinomycetota bacterium]